MRLPVKQRQRTSLDAAMTPMIDVVFLLLIFFVCTSSFRIVEQRLPSTLAPLEQGADAKPIEPREVDLERIVVRGLWRENRTEWQLNEQAFADLASLRGALARLRRQMASLGTDVTALPLVLDVDGPAPLGDVIDAYDACRLESFRKIQFVAPADDAA